LPVTTKYTWQFPDGDSSNNQNPSKLLNQIGKNKVTLILRSSNGCNDAITKNVDVKQEATANFTANDVCEDSAVNFINTSKDGLNYEWKYGDGKSSNLESPKHQYLISGVTQTFNVSLIAKVPNGCADTITNSVTINANPKSDFSFTTSDRQVSFTAIEKSATNYNWTFGDGGTSNTTNPKTTYNYSKFPSGKYTACLKVSNIAGCVSETCKEVNITGLATQLVKESGFKIYPNPSQGSFTVEVLNQKGPIVIEVYNSTGQLVYKRISSQSIVKLDLMVPNGVYLIRVNNGEQVFNKNILINK
jgi:PKD repeat protein